MAKQTTKTSLLKTSSFALQTVDATKYYDATLSGNGLTATAHTILSKIDSVFTGDSLTARGNNNTLTGGAGNDLLVSSGSNNLLVASAGSDTMVSGANGATFQVGSVAQLTASSISGGSGSDTLRLTAAAQLTDAQFAKVKGTEVLSLNGASSVVLGGTAKAAGINFVVAGSGKSTLTQGAGYTGALTLSGGGANDLIVVATGAQLASDSISGGTAGVDTIQVVAQSSLADTSFANVSGIEVLSLTGASAVTLGGNAALAGFSTVIAGSVNQLASDNAALVMIGSSLNDSYSVATVAQLAADKIIAGAGIDTLSLSQAAILTDASFSNVTGVEVLSLIGNSSVILDKGATKAGISTVLGAQAGSLAVSVTAGNTSKLSLAGGNLGDSFTFTNAKSLATDTVVGGGGSDTLAITTAGILLDAQFANVHTTEVLSLTGASAVTVGSVAQAAGINFIQGGAAGGKFTETAGYTGPLTLAGGIGNDLFTVANSGQLAADSIAGNGGTDTLFVASAASFNDSSFSGLEVLSLTGASNITLGHNTASTGTATVFGGSGDSKFTLTNGGYNVIAGNGNDAFSLTSAALLTLTGASGLTLAGGKGINTLTVGDTLKLTDSSFANLSGVQILSLTGNASVELGSAALAAGIGQVQIKNTSTLGHSDTVTQTAEFTRNLNIFTDGGDDLIILDNGVQMAKDTVDGGTGTNTLQIANHSVLLDKSFANIQNTQILSLADDDGYNVTMGSLAGNAGVATILAAGSKDTINAAQYDGGADALIFDVSASDGSNLLIGSAKASNSFLIGGNDALKNSTITGGSSTDGDSIVITSADESVTDEAFANVRGIEILSLNGSASIELGAAAALSGLSTIYGGDGDMTFTQSAGRFDLEAGSTLASASNLFEFSTAAVAAGDTITGAGFDTLQIDTAGVIGDSLFANKTGIETVSLTGSSAITLGDQAANLASDNSDGRFTLFGGAGHSTISQTGDAPFYIDGTAGSGNYFNISADLLANDTLVGSGSDTLADTLAIAGKETGDDAFANVTGVGVLQLTGDSLGNASVTLDGNASSSAFATVLGSSGSMSFSQTAPSENGFVLDGSLADSNLFTFIEATLASTVPGSTSVDTLSASDILATNTLIGGAGIDAIVLASDAEFSTDDAFANVQGVEVLSLTGSSSVILDTLAGAHGLSSVYGGDGDMKFTQNGGSYYLNGSESNSNIFNLADTSLVSGDTIVGSDGDDSLAIAGDGQLDDVDFAHLSDVPSLVLNGSDSVILGDIAANSGLSTIYGGEGDTTITQLSGAYDFEAGDSLNGAMLVNVADVALAGDDTFIGNGDKSTLSFAEGEISDDAFANASLVGNILLTRSSAIELDTNADKAGIVNVIGGTGDSTFTQHTGSFNLDGSGGTSNLFALDYASLAGSFGDTIVGSGKGDTLFIANDDTLTGVVDADFTNITDVSVLSLTGSSNVALGSLASATGIAEVITGDGDTKIELAAGGPTIVLDGLLSNSLLVTIDDAAMAADETLYGGAGVNTLAFAAGNAITDDAFTNIYSFGALSLSGSSSVTLDANAAAAYIDSIYGGSGQTTITQGAGNANPLMIDGKAGSDLIVLDSALYLLNDTITGGSSTLGNTLAVNTAADITDAYFANDLLLGTLSLAGDSSVVLGSNADNAGVKAVMVSDGSNSFTLMTDAPQSILIDATGSDSNLFALANAAQMAADTIFGGSSTLGDTLTVSAEESISDLLFKNIQSVEVLQLTGSSDVTLGGAYSDAAGIETVIGGAGSSTFTQDALSSNSYYLDGSAGTDNLFNIGNAGQAAGDTILGGTGTDTLTIATEDSISDADLASVFANVNSVSVLQLTGSSDVTLGSYADGTGIMSVVGGTGSSTFTQGALSESSYYLDGSNGLSNLFAVDNAIQAAVDTFAGGAGSDTLQIGEDSIDDTAFTNVNSVETLQLTGSSDVTLGSAAYNSGIATVIGGTGSSTITESIDNYYPALVLDGSNGSNNLFVISDAYATSIDTILGSAGRDTLQIGQDSIDDTAFAHVDSVAALQLTGSSDVTLGHAADLAGFATIIGGTGSSTMTQNAQNYSALVLDGSNGSNNLFVISDAYSTGFDTILGSTGSDTLQIGQDTIDDTAFAHVDSVAALQLTGSSDVTLGHAADLAGFTTIIGGTGSSTFTQDSPNYSALVLDGSNGSNNLFVIDDAYSTGRDTIIGGGGSDTLQIATADAIDDSTFAHVTGVPVLQLTGASDVTLAGSAQAAGITSVISGFGATSIDASALTRSVILDASSSSGNSQLLGGSSADTLTGGSGGDTLQAWSSTGNTASDTSTGGSGADLFVLGNAAANAYGNVNSGNVALITDFTGGTDSLQLHEYGTGASDYSLVGGSWGSGATAYNEQLFDVHGGGSILLANINYVGSDASGDLLGAKALFA